MAYVKCTVKDGLRPSEASVGVEGLEGDCAYLRVERHYVQSFDGSDWLPIGIVYRDKTNGRERVLIELPHEADSGANRLWVDSSRVVEPERRQQEAPV